MLCKNNKMENGVTLVTLTIYIIVFIMIITIMANISNYFYRNIGQIKDSPRYISEFNKFSMFFVADVKRNSQIVSCSDTDLEFADGTKYSYMNNSIYRNDTIIARYIRNFSFGKLEYKTDKFSKTIINTNMTIGNNKDQIVRNVDFVLRYW